MYIYIHTYNIHTFTYILVHMCAHARTDLHACIHTYMPICKHIQDNRKTNMLDNQQFRFDNTKDVPMHSKLTKPTYTYTHTTVHIYPQTYIQTNIHTYIHTTYTHTNEYVYIKTGQPKIPSRLQKGKGHAHKNDQR